MPTPVTYANLGTKVALQIGTLNSANGGGAQNVATYLGARAGIIQDMFEAADLSGIKIKAVGTLPSMDLAALAAAMGHPIANPLPPFETACDTVDTKIYPILQFFSGTLSPYLTGITYNNNIYLKTAFRDNLEILVHEIVHALQWQNFGPARFLEKYIQGYVVAGGVTPSSNYFKISAEKRAYHYQAKYFAEATKKGAGLTSVMSMPPSPSDPKYARMRTHPTEGAMVTLIGRLRGLRPKGRITVAKAISGM